MEKMKRNSKQTKFQELEVKHFFALIYSQIERKAFSEECIRLKGVIKEEQTKNIEHFRLNY